MEYAVVLDQYREAPTLLDRVMAYKNDRVVEKFLEEYKVSEVAAQDIFKETKRWLYFCYLGQSEGQRLEITESILVLDKMWHHFVMFTKDYAAFCQEMFGEFIHHVPVTSSDYSKLIKAHTKPGKSIHEHKQKTLERQLNFVLTHLGRETLEKWYCDYSYIYSPKALSGMVKPIFSETSRVAISGPARQEISGFDSGRVVSTIMGKYITSYYCGTNCGPYCSCSDADAS